MCHTCSGFGKFCFKNFDIQFIRVANTDELVVDGGGGVGDSIKINFCPMCGRSLTPLAPDAPPESCEHGNLRGKCPVEICSYSKHGWRR